MTRIITQSPDGTVTITIPGIGPVSGKSLAEAEAEFRRLSTLKEAA